MVNIEQLDFFTQEKGNSVKSSVSTVLPVELKEDILAVAKHYEISANTVVTKCIELALDSDIDFASNEEKSNKPTASLSVSLKKSTVTELRKIAKENKIAVSTVVRLCVIYTFAQPWKQEQEETKKYTTMGKNIYDWAFTLGIDTDADDFLPQLKKRAMFFLQDMKQQHETSTDLTEEQEATERVRKHLLNMLDCISSNSGQEEPTLVYNENVPSKEELDTAREKIKKLENKLSEIFQNKQNYDFYELGKNLYELLVTKYNDAYRYHLTVTCYDDFNKRSEHYLGGLSRPMGENNPTIGLLNPDDQPRFPFPITSANNKH